MKNTSIIKKNYDFQKIIGEKKCYKSNQFFIYYSKNDSGFKYGISVGKKLGIAVTRNKIKRQVRTMIRSFLSEVKETNYKIIIIVRKTYFDFEYDVNRESLKKSVFSIAKK